MYVAAIEQLMLFDTVPDYVLNLVVAVVIAELDDLLAMMVVHFVGSLFENALPCATS